MEEKVKGFDVREKADKDVAAECVSSSNRWLVQTQLHRLLPDHPG